MEEPAAMESKEEKQDQKPRFQIPKIPSGIISLGQNVGSSAQIGFKKGLGRVGSGLGSIFGSAARAGGGVLVKAGGFAGDAMVRASNQISRGSFVKGPGKVVWAFIGAFFLLFILGSIAIPGLPTGTPTGEAAPIPTTTTSTAFAPASSITSCDFIHQNRIYRVGSNKLNSLFQEVSVKSGIPASALAAIALQESANFTVQANDDHPAFSAADFPNPGCDPYFLTSRTGALGLMQIQPPPYISTHGADYDPKAADLEGIKIGLSFLGRDLASLAKNDFCNVRTSIYLGAGVMINKNGGLTPTTPDEIRAVACKYHGLCQVGPYSYADEVRQGFEACKAQPTAALATASECLIPSGRVLCGSQFTPINDCGHCGLNYGPMQNCVYEGTRYAVDITGTPNQSILLPKVNNSMIQWVFMRQETGSSQAIQAYAGTDPSGKKYFLQLHHTQPGSGNTKGGVSGQAGGVIWSGGDHVHVQIGDGGDSPGNTRWLDAAMNFCRKP